MFVLHFNLCVYANGDAAVHAEHSWADAPVIAHGWEWVLCHEVYADPYEADGSLKQGSHVGDQAGKVKAASPHAPLLTPVRLQWNLSSKAGQAVLDAAQFSRELHNAKMVQQEIGFSLRIYRITLENSDHSLTLRLPT